MKAAKFFIKAANFIISAVVALTLLAAGSYSAYALWDNAQVYNAVDNVMEELISLKPSVDPEEDNGASFEELLAINPDVCAWLTLDGTKIDYPILQGADNLSYINTDVYGNYVLSGSIFLDSRCDRNYNIAYSLVYGHHMANSKMFGDLDKYKDEDFFKENTTGLLILPDRTYNLEIFACLVVKSSESNIFQPYRWQTDIKGLLDFATENSLHTRTELIEEIRSAESPQVIALSTCSTEYTDARTIVLAYMTPYTPVTQVGG